MPGYTVSTETSANVNLPTTTETVVATLTGVSNSAPGKAIRLSGMAKLSTGANATALNLRIRRDSVTGTEVVESNGVQIEAVAGSTEDHNISGDDLLTGEVFNATYVLTAQQVAATADGTCVYSHFVAECE